MKGILIQVLSAFILSIVNFAAGFSVSWTSYTLELLESDSSPIGARVTKQEGYMIGSLPMLGCFIISLLAGWVSDMIGKKKTELLSGLCLSLASAIIATASSVQALLIGRFIIGVALGFHLVASIPFISELCQPFIRGTLASIVLASFSTGGLVSYLMGWTCSYDVINYLCLTLSASFVFLVSFMPESPGYFLANGDEKEALKSLKFYRGVSKTTQDILDEIEYLRNQLQATKFTEVHDCGKIKTEISNLEAEKQTLQGPIVDPESDDTSISAWKMFYTSKSAQRALVTATLFVVIQALGGPIAVQAYAGRLFKSAAPTLSPHMCSVVLAIAFTVGSALSALVTDLVGRRSLMMFSSSLSAFWLAVLASLLRWSWAPEWTIPAAVLAYCCSFQIGAANIPFIQLSECFHPKLKGYASTVAISSLCLANFMMLMFFGPVSEFIGLDGTFLMVSSICAIITVLSYLILKETKGVPWENVDKMYAQGYICTGTANTNK